MNMCGKFLEKAIKNDHPSSQCLGIDRRYRRSIFEDITLRGIMFSGFTSWWGWFTRSTPLVKQSQSYIIIHLSIYSVYGSKPLATKKPPKTSKTLKTWVVWKFGPLKVVFVGESLEVVFPCLLGPKKTNGSGSTNRVFAHQKPPPTATPSNSADQPCPG